MKAFLRARHPLTTLQAYKNETTKGNRKNTGRFVAFVFVRNFMAGSVKNMKKTTTVSMTGTALCMALGLVLPVLFHMVGAGPTFLPMHIPVLLCGLLFGWQCGAVCGAAVPLLSSLLTGMPPLFPVGAAMVFELCAYGVLTGVLYRKLRWNIYLALICSMLGGRAVSGIANAAFLGMAGRPYGVSAFLSSSFVTSLPGIVIQIVAVPLIVVALEKARVVKRDGT